MKKTVFLIFAILVCAALLPSCAGSDSGTETTVPPEASASEPTTAQPVTVGPEGDPFLLVLEDNAGTWVIADETGEKQLYAVTDLDGNGRPELISCASGGSGLYSAARFYEVTEAADGIAPCEYDLSGAESEPDLADSFWRYYEKDGVRSYIVEDVLRETASSQTVYKYALTFADGAARTELLAYCESRMEGMDVQTRCFDADGGELTQEAYDAVEAERFASYSEGRAELGWFDLNEEGSLTDKLTASYAVFLGQ